MTDVPPPSNDVESSDTQFEGDEAYCVACNQSFSLDQMFCPTDGSKLIKLRSSPDQLIGRVFDERYELRGVLGQGGMGTVYRAWQRSVDREVAVKVIHPKLASVREVAKRFLREARLASRLNQPNIVNVYDFGQSDDGVLYLVMELLRGKPLSDEFAAHQPLPLRRIVAIAAQVCDALDAAHQQGIIHRDLKPHNIILLDEPPGRDRIKILDFGLAKSLTHQATSLVTQIDAVLGTPAYISPEQILGKPVDPRADLYSLGCMLYQMATGKPPFRGETLNAVLGMHLRTPPPPLPDSVPPALATIIARLMAKEPEGRPATAALVHAAVTSMASGSAFAIPDPGHQPPSSIDGRHGRRRVRVIAGTAIATIAAALAVIALRPARPADRENAAKPMNTTTVDHAIDAAGSGTPIPVDASVAETVPSDEIAPGAPEKSPTRKDATASGATVPSAITLPPPTKTRPRAAESPTKPSAGTRPRPQSASQDELPPTSNPRNPHVDKRPDAGLPDLDLIPTGKGSPL